MTRAKQVQLMVFATASMCGFLAGGAFFLALNGSFGRAAFWACLSAVNGYLWRVNHKRDRALTAATHPKDWRP